MAKTVDEKRAKKAQKFITGSKSQFKKFIPRDKIDGIEVLECVEKGSAFAIKGSVAATSPTGKLKTYGFSATVNSDADGVCSLAALQVNE